MSAERGPLPTENTLDHFPELAENQYVVCQYRYAGEGEEQLSCVKDADEMAQWLTAADYGMITIDRLYTTEFNFDTAN